MMQRVTLGELRAAGDLDFGDGYRTRADQLEPEGFRIIRAADVLDGSVSLAGPDFVGFEYATAIGSKQARTGDVVLTTKGTVGRVAMVPAIREPVVYSPQLCYFRVRIGRRLEAAYLQYWLHSPEFAGQAGFVMHNTDMAPYISLRDLSSMRISLPPLSTQQAIAEVLGALDDKIAASHNLARVAAELAQRRFDSLASGLPHVALTQLSVPLLGGTPSRSDAKLWSGPVKWVSARDVTAATQHVLLDTAECMSEAASRSAARLAAHPVGTVVLTARGTVGEVARLATPAAINQSCYAFQPGTTPASLLYFAVRAAVDRMRAMAHGSVFSTVNMSTLAGVNVPDIRRLAASGEPVTALLDLVTETVRENRVLANLRDALLPELMSGRLRVRDAERAVEDAL